jgi:hypothetical protein
MAIRQMIQLADGGLSVTSESSTGAAGPPCGGAPGSAIPPFTRLNDAHSNVEDEP